MYTLILKDKKNIIAMNRLQKTKGVKNMENRERILLKEKNLTNWIVNNPSDWEKVCGLRFTTIKDMKRLMKTLDEKGFNQLSDLMATRWYAAMIDIENNEPRY